MNNNKIYDANRGEFLSSLIKENYIGVELGVQNGNFSHEILSKSNIKLLYSIDRWAGDRGHDINEYKNTIKNLQKFYSRNSIIKMEFEEALNLFDDEYFDFIYIDGYAHTGQDDGKTLYQWWPKLKIGGIFSGHDYDIMFPKTIKCVDEFLHEIEYFDKLKIIRNKPYDSWCIIK